MSLDPFATLAIAPTLDVGAIKRAYFAGLKQSPPHADPEGFRRLRAAYEALTKRGGAAAAFLASPPPACPALHEKWQGLVDHAREGVAAERERRGAIARFVASVSARSWEEAARSPAGGAPGR